MQLEAEQPAFSTLKVIELTLVYNKSAVLTALFEFYDKYRRISRKNPSMVL